MGQLILSEAIGYQQKYNIKGPAEPDKTHSTSRVLKSHPYFILVRDTIQDKFHSC